MFVRLFVQTLIIIIICLVISQILYTVSHPKKK